VQFGVLSSVASFHGGIISARALPKLEPGWNRTRCDCFCDHRRAYLRLFVQLTLERHDFDKRSVVGMTEKRILKVTVSTLDRFDDESEYRLRIPARYIVDSEGVTPGREVDADYTIRPEPSDTLRSLKEIVEASPVAGLQRRSLGKTPLLSSREEDNAFATSVALLAVVALNVSGVMDFSLRHRRNRVLLKPGQRLWPSTLSFAERAAREFRPVPQISKPALKSRCALWFGLRYMSWRRRPRLNAIRTVDVSTGNGSHQ